MQNVYAPLAYSGLGDASPTGFSDVSFGYVYNRTLTASQVVQNDSVPIQNDADFVWRGVIVNFRTSNGFRTRWSDSQWYYLSSGMIEGANILGDASSPYPIFPELIIPAGGRIGIDITDTSAAENVIQLLFVGVKRFRITGTPGLLPG